MSLAVTRTRGPCYDLLGPSALGSTVRHWKAAECYRARNSAHRPKGADSSKGLDCESTLTFAASGSVPNANEPTALPGTSRPSNVDATVTRPGCRCSKSKDGRRSHSSYKRPERSQSTRSRKLRPRHQRQTLPRLLQRRRLRFRTHRPSRSTKNNPSKSNKTVRQPRQLSPRMRRRIRHRHRPQPSHPKTLRNPTTLLENIERNVVAIGNVDAAAIAAPRQRTTRTSNRVANPLKTRVRRRNRTIRRGIGFQPVISLDFDRLEAYPTGMVWNR